MKKRFKLFTNSDLKKIAMLCEKRPDEIHKRTLKDIKTYFQDTNKVKQILKKNNPILYKVYIRHGLLDYGLTVINKGNISNEFYFTKGHKHKNQSEELYYLLEGTGYLMIKKKQTKLIKLKGKHIVPKGYAHRLINTGNSKLKVLTVYDPKAKHDYKIKFDKRIFK